MNVKKLLSKFISNPLDNRLISSTTTAMSLGSFSANGAVVNGESVVTKSGYYPIALSGFNINTLNIRIAQVMITNYAKGSATVRYSLKNTTSSAISDTKLYVNIVWYKLGSTE
jgi:hypothetical protein